MNKYDKMIEENQRKSKEKICLAQQTIHTYFTDKQLLKKLKLFEFNFQHAINTEL